jgi:hypothetical protein
VEGCEYGVPETRLVYFLAFVGKICSLNIEDTFENGISPNGNVGTNRTGTYSVKIQLMRNIPQLHSIMGKRVKIYFPGIQKLCPNCYGPHPK